MRMNPGMIQICNTSRNTYQNNQIVFNHLAQWTFDDWCNKVDKDRAPPIQQWKLYVNRNYPQQNDQINCGVYTIKGSELMAGGQNITDMITTKIAAKSYRCEILASLLHNNDL
eukprot:141182_1